MDEERLQSLKEKLERGELTKEEVKELMDFVEENLDEINRALDEVLLEGTNGEA